jgi:hypothetical protein
VRAWALLGLLAAASWLAAPAPGRAQDSCPRCTVGDATDALPGHGSLAVPRLQRAVSASFQAAGSYGLNLDPAGPGSTHHRLGGSIAGAVHVVPWLAFGLRMLGRYDLVSTTAGSDDGLFGYPSLSVRLSAEPVAGFTMGLDAQAMVFGAEAPSFELASTSVLLRALLAYSIDLGGSRFVVTFNGGYYIDNSRAAAPRGVTDNLSVQDRVSLGVSDSGAVVLGLGGLYAGDVIEVFGDVGYRLYVGDGLIGQSPLRIGVGARFWAVPEVFFIGVGADIRATPQSTALIDPAATSNAPIEPGFSASLALGVRVGAETPPDAIVTDDATDGEDEEEVEETPPAPTVGSAVGRVTDADGSPVVGAAVEVTSDADGSTRTATSDQDGRWQIGDLPIGSARYRITAEGRDPAEGTLTITPDAPVEASSQMTRSLPQGEIRGVIQGSNGAPIAARVVIRPLGRELTADAEGSFAVEVPPGEYDVEVSAPGHREQTRHVTVSERGVVVLNVQLRPGGRGRTR